MINALGPGARLVFGANDGHMLAVLAERTKYIQPAGHSRAWKELAKGGRQLYCIRSPNSILVRASQPANT
jgi:hypothetical protein